MQVLWDKYSMNIALLMRHMTLYLAQFRPDGSGKDLYTRFLEEMAGKDTVEEVLFSTLNYECALELSASALGMQVNYGDSESGQNVVRIWKLHGSCNFLTSGVQAGSGIHFGRGIVFNGQLSPVNPNDAIQYCLSGSGLYPAMALYMNAKPIQIGQDVIHALQQQWGEWVKQAKRVLIIGVRPYPEDEHIWGPLAACEGHIGYVGPESVFNEWKDLYRAGKSSIWVGSRWHQCLEDCIAFLAGR